jgi:hypothetical protein
MKILVRVANLLGLLACVGLLIVGAALSRLIGDGAPQPTTSPTWQMALGNLLVISPFIYFTICFGTSFARQGGRIGAWGMVAHLFLAYFNLGMFALQISKRPLHLESLLGFLPLLGVSMGFSTLWYAMYRGLKTDLPGGLRDQIPRTD